MSARIITTREGRFINVDDVKNALRNDEFVNTKLVPLLKVGHERGDNITQILRIVALDAIIELLP